MKYTRTKYVIPDLPKWMNWLRKAGVSRIDVSSRSKVSLRTIDKMVRENFPVQHPTANSVIMVLNAELEKAGLPPVAIELAPDEDEEPAPYASSQIA